MDIGAIISTSVQKAVVTYTKPEPHQVMSELLQALSEVQKRCIPVVNAKKEVVPAIHIEPLPIEQAKTIVITKNSDDSFFAALIPSDVPYFPVQCGLDADAPFQSCKSLAEAVCLVTDKLASKYLLRDQLRSTLILG